MMQKWPYLLAIAILVTGTIFIETFSFSEEIVSNKPFAQFPLRLADRWVGRDVGLDEKIEKGLELSDYMMRFYVPVAAQAEEGSGFNDPDGKALSLPVWLYVGFYQSQRTGSTYHLPKNCLPGAGWQIMKSEYVTLSMPGDQLVKINKVLVQKGLNKQVILYWYHERGRVLASEYWAKGYLVWDSMTKHRSDGALVRISVPVKEETVAEAYEHGQEFLHDLWPVLLEYMPDHTII